MTTWEPAPRNYVEEVMTRQRDELGPNQRHAFDAIRVPIRRVPIADDHPNGVYVVAEHDGMVVYWEDVEEGWNTAVLDSSGQIPTRGLEQDNLAAVVHRLGIVEVGAR